MAGALDGIRVIDFGQYIAGPMTAMLLGDQGADVIHIDPPGGPRFNTPANATWGRNKRNIVLDLKEAKDLDTARRLVDGADVVVENFRPGVMERLGLGAVEMTARNPKLIYTSLPGFAGDDPRRDVRAWEGVVAAATATYRPSPQTNRPVYTALPFSSCYAAFLAAMSTGVALNVRERDGLGQVIEVPLFDATYAAIGIRGLKVHNNPAAGDMRAMSRMLGWTRQFECKDGRWFMYHAGNQNVPQFFAATGADAWALSEAWEGLSEDEQQQQIAALFKTRTAAEWETLCEEVGTEGAVCRTTAEWLENPGALGSRIIVDGEDPLLGTVRGPGINVRLSETPGSIRMPRSVPDAHRSEILAGLNGRAPAEATPPGEPEKALAGVKVLDLCIILAGPTCGRTLAEFGAEVIKIDSPHRPRVAFHNDVNRGKDSIVLDLKTPEGLEIFWELLEDADVVVQNFRKGVADKLGVGCEAVKARKPDIVYASLNTYGQIGPFAGRPGHEQIAQAASGMQERYGGERPVLAPFAVNDYGTGLMGAYGVMLALLERRRTGRGQHVDTALAFTATMFQSLLLPSYAGKEWNEPRGQDALGEGPLYRAYEASDGWLFLATRAEQLGSVPALAHAAKLKGDDLTRALEEGFRTQTVESWTAALQAAGIGAHRVVEDAWELMESEWAKTHGLSVTREHDGLGPVTTIGPSARLSRTPPEPGKPAPRPGSDAKLVLASIGRDGDLERLVDSGVVVTEGVVAG